MGSDTKMTLLKLAAILEKMAIECLLVTIDKGTHPYFGKYPKSDLWAKFGAFVRSVTVKSLRDLTKGENGKKLKEKFEEECGSAKKGNPLQKAK